MRKDFPDDKGMIHLYWSLMQLSEDTKDIVVPLPALAFMNSVDVASLDSTTFYKFTQLVVMTQMRLEDPNDGSSIGVDFQAIFDQVVGLSEDKRERIASEHPAAKTNTAIVGEVRAFLRKNLPAMFEGEEGQETNVEVMKGPLTDDFLNVIEIACSVRNNKVSTE